MYHFCNKKCRLGLVRLGKERRIGIITLLFNAVCLDFFQKKKGKLPVVENFNVIIVYKIAKIKHVQIFIKIGRVY